MKRAARAMYEPWLDAGARHFQDLVRTEAKVALGVVGERDVCVLLSMDCGSTLAPPWQGSWSSGG